MEKLIIENTGDYYHSPSGTYKKWGGDVAKNKALTAAFLSTLVIAAGYTPGKTTTSHGTTKVFIKEFGELFCIAAIHESRGSYYSGGKKTTAVSNYEFESKSGDVCESFNHPDKLIQALPQLMNRHGGDGIIMKKGDAYRTKATL